VSRCGRLAHPGEITSPPGIIQKLKRNLPRDAKNDFERLEEACAPRVDGAVAPVTTVTTQVRKKIAIKAKRELAGRMVPA
jgi:hypothetical protein